ncbi:hypothetical protein AAFF_G00114940 [Aldrovandia affinis]|uniref:Caspase-8 n=1 Tax=Aldrovandia affinis TaxID=143900 RepID=A0AAD7WAR3_9TELE|nr:hypothetical protein AAFF_G00114940 [Aldrovandia affinis]
MDVATLHEIDSDLDSQDVANLKFLCRDLVPRKQLEGVEAARDLFLRLKEQGLLGEDGLLLEELLRTIRRLDLLRTLEGPGRSLGTRAGVNSGLSPYRKMLYELSEDVTEETLKSFKFLVKLPRNRLESCTSFLDVLLEMEKQDLLNEDRVDVLGDVLLRCNKPLAAKVQEYAARLAAGGAARQRVPAQQHSGRGNRYPQPRNQAHNLSVQESSPGVFPNNLCLDAAPEHVPEHTPELTPEQAEDYYATRSRPLGHCLIINNYNFEEARAKKKHLGDRKGTDRDAEDLRTVFTRLHFQVEVRTDMTGAQLLAAAWEFGALDHGGRDVFVCCVLSHGEKGSVHGVDGKPVPIRTLTLPFTGSRCPSLAHKPKLFFIQACQGQDLQRGAAIQADGEGEEESEGAAYATDAGSFLPDTIPDDSDFLLGMATVEDCKSFRSVTQGSIFIQELCRQLVRGCIEKADILTIMTRVNREVSSGVYLSSKQMPEPRYTLRRKLVLPID